MRVQVTTQGEQQRWARADAFCEARDLLFPPGTVLRSFLSNADPEGEGQAVAMEELKDTTMRVADMILSGSLVVP